MKAERAYTEKTSIARQRHCKHIPAVKNNCAKTEKFLETVFSIQSVPRLYKESQQEAGTSICTIALRIVDEKET
jgi:hypothetical protein